MLMSSNQASDNVFAIFLQDNSRAGPHLKLGGYDEMTDILPKGGNMVWLKTVH